MNIAPAKPITADELLATGDIDRCELVAGEIVTMAPASFEHGDIASEINSQIRVFVRSRKLGTVLAAETGFMLRRNPDTVRAADVAFVRRDRLPKRKLPGFFEGAPDLAIEVLSPSDRTLAVHEKVKEWLAAGAQSVWVVDPQNRAIDIYRSGGSVNHYQGLDKIENEPALPGFTLSLADVFIVD
jgi:Uma2 family endonuclease